MEKVAKHVLSPTMQKIRLHFCCWRKVFELSRASKICFESSSLELFALNTSTNAVKDCNLIRKFSIFSSQLENVNFRVPKDSADNPTIPLTSLEKSFHTKLSSPVSQVYSVYTEGHIFKLQNSKAFLENTRRGKRKSWVWSGAWYVHKLV